VTTVSRRAARTGPARETKRPGRWIALIVAVLIGFSACASGADQLDVARVRRAVDTRARLDYPGVALGPTRCPKAVDKRRGASFVCTVPVGNLRLRVRVAQRDANGHIQLAAQQAVIQKMSAEQFVALHASISATVSCGTQPVLVLAPGARFPCSVSFTDGTMQAVSVRVVDTGGTVVIETPPKP
jgi:uncharacterized protein (UPF0212 family)